MARTTLLAVLKVLMALIFAAWVTLWILKPTRLWTRKWKAPEDLARPTVFGYYGLNFAVFTFPLIALATVGSIYLNLKPREPIRRKGRRAIPGFSYPLVVNSLLGILSSIEIVAVFLFMLSLAWTFYIRISNYFKNLKPDKALKLNLWQLKYLRVATRFGLLAEACLAFLLLPVLRASAQGQFCSSRSRSVSEQLKERRAPGRNRRQLRKQQRARAIARAKGARVFASSGRRAPALRG